MRSKRGAARVSAVWMITVGVLFLAALAFAFIASSDLSKAKDARATAESNAAEAVASREELNERKRNISSVLGWYDRENVDTESDPAAAQAALAELRTTFSDLTESDADFQTALPKVVAAYTARGRKVAELETRIQGLEADVTAANASVATIQTDKDKLISDLRQELEDEKQNAAQRESELQARLDTANEELSTRDSELRQTRAEMAELTRGFEDEVKLLQTRNANLAKDVGFTRQPYGDQPDGSVIEVSPKLGIAFIDIGATSRLARGMRFRIESGQPGGRYLKAMGEVIDVNADTAEIAISGQVDRYDPVVAGDVIVNPLFDGKSERNAVLVGRFSGAYNREDLEVLLSRMGIRVQPKVDNTTHYLIVGSELYYDPETSEPLEEPLQPSELADYKNAEANAVQIIPLQDVREFFDVGVATKGL